MGGLQMKRSINMSCLLENGFTFVYTMDEVVSLQDESIFEQILIDYKEVNIPTNPLKKYKVYQLGGE